MEGLFTLDSAFTLLMLVLLQVVLGFDNLLYISLESKKAPQEKQSYVRKLGVGLAIVLRIVLLFALMSLIQYFQEPFASLHDNSIVEFSFNVHSIIVLLGGIFIIYTAIKEIWHMMHLKEHAATDAKKSSVGKIIFWIVVMNLVFSFDSILSAMALTSGMEFTGQMILMSIAIMAGGVLMIVLADKVSNFLQKNRMYEVLGLFILLIVGVMLLSEGGHLAHLTLFGNPVTPMSKTTFDFEGNYNRIQYDLQAGINWKNNWFTEVGYGHKPRIFINTFLRGGPRWRFSDENFAFAFSGTDQRKKFSIVLGYVYSQARENNFQFRRYEVRFNWQPLDALSLNLETTYESNPNKTQYVSQAAFAPAQFGTRYITGEIDQETFTTTLRVNYNINPNLHLQHTCHLEN